MPLNGGDNLKKVFKSFVIILTILFLLTPLCFANDTPDLKAQIKKEDGSLFEKIIAECIRWNCTNNSRFYNW